MTSDSSNPDTGLRATAGSLNLHASCVEIEGRGVLILGPSGAGKSSLALQLIALGGRLVADDRTFVARSGETLIASAPAALFGLIEARHIGILRSPAVAQTALFMAVDLGQPEPQRLPDPQSIEVFGVKLPLVRGAAVPHFPSALMCYVRDGRQA